MKLYHIIWLDAEVTEDRWTDIDDAIISCGDELVPCETVGFLLKDTGDRIHITQTDGSTCVGPITHIPVCSIISRREIHAQERDSQKGKETGEQDASGTAYPVTD